MAKDSIFEISGIRFIAMLMIVVCHFMQFYGNDLAYWFNVGVQIFLIISGFLYGNKEFKLDPVEWLTIRFSKILVPYWMLLFLYICLSSLVSVELQFVEICKSLFGFGNLPGLNHLWFIPNILFCYVITPYVKSIIVRSNGSFFTFGVFLFIYIIVSSIVNLYFRHDFISCYILGLFIGFHWYKSKKKDIFIRNISFCFIFLALITNLIRIYFPLVGYINHSIFTVYANYCHLLLGLAFFCISFMLFRSINLKFNIFKISDRYSYYIYLTHHIFILSPLSLMSLTNNCIFNILIVLMLSVISSVIIKKLSELIETNCFCRKNANIEK